MNDIFEAYATLSIEEERTKTQIDVIKELNSDNYVTVSGLKDQVLKQSIEQQSKEKLTEFNINPLYRYNGGFPNRFSENRGTALGKPGQFHSIDNEWAKTESDHDTDFKVTERDVDLFTEVRKSQKEYFDTYRSYYRPEVIEKFKMSERFDTLHKVFGFIVGLFFLRELFRRNAQRNRKNTEYLLNSGRVKKTKDGVVYFGD